MKTRKRVLSLVLALLLCTALATPVSAEGKAPDVLWFKIDHPGDVDLVFANYIEELGILSISVRLGKVGDLNWSSPTVNIDVATGEVSEEYKNWDIEPFSGGLARFRDGVKYGFLDTSGNVAIEPKYYAATDFIGGYSWVYLGNNSYAVIDTKGNEYPCDKNSDEPIFKFLGQSILNQSSYQGNQTNGALKIEGYIGFALIDTEFNYLVEPGKYSYIGSFYGDLAVVRSQDEKEGMINAKGEEVVPCIYKRIAYSGYSDLICVIKETEAGDRYGYVDRTGKVVIPIQYEYAGEFRDGLADRTNGYIDETGKEVFHKDYSNYRYEFKYQNGFLPFYERNVSNENCRFALLDKTGTRATGWMDGYAASVESNGLIRAYISKNGRDCEVWYDMDGNEIASRENYDFIVHAQGAADHEDKFGYLVVISSDKIGCIKSSDKTPTTPDPQPTEPKPTEPKPTEPKPTEPKPTEPKPTEPKPTEPKPTEPKPTEPQPTEPKPTEPQPTEPRPTEPQPTEPQPTTPRPTEPQPTTPLNPTIPEPEDVLVVPEGAGRYTLPVEVKVGDGRALEIRVQGDGKAAVEVPVKDAGPGTVVIVVRENGAEEVVRDCVLTEDGLLFDVEGSVTVKLEDRAGAFTDMAGEQAWARDAVAYVSARGLFNGTDVGVFSPDEDTTRGMTATVLFRLMYEPETAASTFGDVPSGKYYADAVAWAQANNIVNGYEDGSFRPDNAITREELATIFYRFAAYRGLDMTVTDSLDGYKDSGKVSGFARDAMAWCVANGIINGVDTGVLAPAAFTTRAQLAAVLMRMCQLAAK